MCAAAAGFDTHVWQLAWALEVFQGRQGYWQESVVSRLSALDAALRLADRPAQARAHRGLGAVYDRLGRHQEALHHLRCALHLYDQVGDAVGQAYTYMNLSIVLARFDGYTDTTLHARRAVDLYQAAGHHPVAEEWDLCADVFTAVAWCRCQLGDYQEALTHCQQGIALNRETGNRAGEACSWDGLGHIYHGLGRYEQALTCFRRVIDIYQDLDARYGEAGTRMRLGETHRAAGDADAARTVWQAALTVLDELGDRDAEKVRAKLQQLDSAAVGARLSDGLQ